MKFRDNILIAALIAAALTISLSTSLNANEFSPWTPEQKLLILLALGAADMMHPFDLLRKRSPLS